MSGLIFYVDERPIDPLIVTVEDRNLTGLGVTVVGDDLPDNNVSVADAATGRVQIDFLEPFDAAGIYQVQLRLASGLESDLTSPIEIEVKDPAEVETSIVDRAQVENWTGVAVSVGEIARAQMMVELVAGVDLTDSDLLANMTASDMRWLQLAIAHQAAAGRSETTIGSVVSSVPGATSVTTGNVSITMGSGSASTASVVGLVPLARMALSRVSWRRTRTLHATPFIGAAVDPHGSRYPDWDWTTGVPDSLLWPQIGTAQP